MVSQTEIIKSMQSIVGTAGVVTDLKDLQESSVDRFRKYEAYNNVFTRPIPTAIVYAENTDQVKSVLLYANKNGVNVIPRSGNSALEQMLESDKENHIILDASRMNKVIKIDKLNMQVTAQAGVPLGDLEDEVRKLGLTTGHSPQSKPLAQMGGLVAVRSIGQFSTLYGGIEDMIVGMEAVFPNGEITRIKNVPRRAAGPDIRHVIVGNEGTLCFITEVTVKLFPYYPENNLFLGFHLSQMQDGLDILREVMVAGYKPSVARVYSKSDAATQFPKFADGKCVLLFMTEGAPEISRANFEGIQKITNKHDELSPIDSKLIEGWFDQLNWGPKQVEDEKEDILKTNDVGFTTEIAADWENIGRIFDAVVDRVPKEIPDMIWIGGHSSHSYINGTNIYFVYYYHVEGISPEEEITKYHNPINKIIVEESLKHGGTMVHHHGVGKARAPWIKEEYGSSFYILKTLKEAFDPNNIMNAGSIIPEKYLD